MWRTLSSGYQLISPALLSHVLVRRGEERLQREFAGARVEAILADEKGRKIEPNGEGARRGLSIAASLCLQLSAVPNAKEVPRSV